MNSQWVKSVRLLFSGFVLCLASSVVTAQDAGPVSNTAASAAAIGADGAAADGTSEEASRRIICKQVTPLGTRFAKKTCKTVAEWDELRRLGSEAARTGTEQSRMIREAPSGG